MKEDQNLNTKEFKMLKSIEVNNVNTAVAQGFQYLVNNGIKSDSRVGKVIVAPGPVCTAYSNPTQRVLFSERRDANPFFHLMESLWMLYGACDLAWPLKFNSRLGS